MRNAFKKVLCLVFALCLLSAFASASGAAARSSDYLSSYQASLSVGSGGDISVYATVNARKSYPEVGVSEIVIYESSNSGKSFSYYDTFYSDDYSSMMGSGIHYSKCALTFTGTVGNQYKATVYCYAGDENGSDAKPYYTTAVTAKR